MQIQRYVGRISGPLLDRMHAVYNARLQPTEIRLGTSQAGIDRLKLNYECGGTTDNNGNVRSQTITVPTVAGITGFTATQTYGYDSLNRLTSAQESGTSWTQNFSYDRYGNRSFISGTTLPASLTFANNPTIDPLNNRINIAASGQPSYSYDGAGNLTHDHNVAGHSFAYDAENKQKSYDGEASPSGGVSYYYDGDGRRVMKVEGGSPMKTTVFIYNIAGQLVAEYTSASPLSPGGTSYLTSDTLGSPRVITGQNQEVKARHDYLPFGEDLIAEQVVRSTDQGYVPDYVRQKFTGYERDGETNLDYAQARYYASAQGRFTSSDPLMASAMTVNPKTWNRYAYTLNNPLRYTDPTGLRTCWEASCSGSEDENKSQDELDYEQRLQNTRDALAAGSALERGEYGTAQGIFNNNQSVGVYVGGLDFWGQHASDFVDNFLTVSQTYSQVASRGLPDLTYNTARILIYSSLVTAYNMLSMLRQPDFFVADAGIGVAGIGIGSSRAIVRGDGMEALTNPMVGASIGTGSGVSASFGWLWQVGTPSRKEIESFLSGVTGQITFFRGLGLGYVRSPNSPTKNAVLAGAGAGGKGAAAGYTRPRQ